MEAAGQTHRARLQDRPRPPGEGDRQVAGRDRAAGNVSNLNADLLDGLDSTAFARRSGDTMTGGLTLAAPAGLSFGSTVRQMLNLWGVQYALGVQANALYSRSHSSFAWFRDGAHSDALFDPGAGGTVLMTLSANGRLDVNGASSTVALNAVDSVGAFSFFRGLKATSDSIFGTAVFGASDNGIAIAGTSANGTAGAFYGPVRVEMDSTLARPQLRLRETQDGDFARLEFQAASRPYWHIAVGGGASNQMNFYNSTNGDVMSLKEDGTLFVKVLTITGGADVAEPFKMSEKDLPKGAVVVIDEDHPGHLKLSSQAYDQRVAGVISGAGGVNPGLSLSQQGLLEGDQPVALTGRVYVQAETSGGAIKPGDLLTTSATPGQAMKVTDHARAQGAILGKAMTGLTEGPWLVLVLVTLQ